MANIVGFIRDKHALWYKGLLFFFSILIITWMLPKQGRTKYEFTQLKGKPWNYENLIAPFDFPIYKTKEEIDDEKSEVKNNAKLYFLQNTALLQKRLLKFDTLGLKNKNLYNAGKPILDSIANRGIIENHDLIQGKKNNYPIIIVANGIAEEKELGNFFTLSSADKFINKSLENYYGQDKTELIDLLENSLALTLFYDDTLTKKSLQQDLENLLPTKSKIVKGQTIINKGEIITPEKYSILISYQIEMERSNVSTTDFLLMLVGQFIAVALCMSMIFLFLAFFRKNIFSQNTHVTFIVLIIVLFIVLCESVFGSEFFNIYFIPFTIVPILIRAFFDTRTALFAHLNVILIASFFAADKFEFYFIETLAGIAAIFSIANMNRRAQLFTSIIVVLFVYLISLFALNFMTTTKMSSLSLNDLIPYTVSGLMVMFAYPLIFISEKLFGFVSDFTLLELSDSNSPLLRDLATKAPGTFQHTLQVASLAEEAIQKVGGNPLLIRTGAMYHDIGKIENPRYFTENQIAGSNPHEDLSYEESAQLIINHVINGVELAKKHRLPEQIIDFIRTHHGTTQVRYFYKKSLMDFGEAHTDVTKFRYGGPVPFSKETAVLMMADSIEASSRSLKNYDAPTIDELVERIINNQIMENQFINADITFRDISNIKKIFKKRLMNIYHVRIEYPR